MKIQPFKAEVLGTFRVTVELNEPAGDMEFDDIEEETRAALYMGGRLNIYRVDEIEYI